MTQDLKKDFIKEVTAAAKVRRAAEVYADMVRAMALSIEGAVTLGARCDEIEKEYAAIKERYTDEEFSHFYAAFAITQAALERAREDFLGHALENLGAANTRNGQFLTPVHVSRLMAKMSGGKPESYKPGVIVRLYDCACGTSVLLIEGAEELVQQGVRQGDLLVIAGDIDGRACDASYVQLSLLGYPAIVQHMDALAQRRISADRYTPGYFLHCMPMRRALAAWSPADEVRTPAPSAPQKFRTEQMELFAKEAV